MNQKRNVLTKPEVTTVQPPQLISALRSGFDAVANHIGLIALPVVLDLFLWFGPHFSLKTLLLPFAQNFANLPGATTPETQDLVRYSQDLWHTLAENLNLASSLRTFPVGMPSLMAGQFPVDTPFGKAFTAQITSIGAGLTVWVLLVLIGLVLGSLYFFTVSQAVAVEKTPRSPRNYAWVAGQSILLSLAFLGLVLIIGLPAMLILSFMAIFSPAIAQIGLLLLSLILVWVMVPLVFSPHGIFLYHQNALYSMLTSVRLVRFIMPGTGMFFLTVIVLSQGLDLLWEVPPATSWMMLIGVGGHAFVTTALLASSFVYYRDGVKWVREFVQQSVAARSV